MIYTVINTGKKEVIKFNKKVMQFWKDAFDDLTNNKKDKDE
jgi:hypothetical protein